MKVTLTDAEVAVIVDALAWTRSDLRDHGHETPNLDTALEKITSLVSGPSVRGLEIRNLS